LRQGDLLPGAASCVRKHLGILSRLSVDHTGFPHILYTSRHLTEFETGVDSHFSRGKDSLTVKVVLFEQVFSLGSGLEVKL
jgi:hypothetical protein